MPGFDDVVVDLQIFFHGLPVYCTLAMIGKQNAAFLATPCVSTSEELALSQDDSLHLRKMQDPRTANRSASLCGFEIVLRANETADIFQ